MTDLIIKDWDGKDLPTKPDDRYAFRISPKSWKLLSNTINYRLGRYIRVPVQVLGQACAGEQIVFVSSASQVHTYGVGFPTPVKAMSFDVVDVDKNKYAIPVRDYPVISKGVCPWYPDSLWNQLVLDPRFPVQEVTHVPNGIADPVVLCEPFPGCAGTEAKET